MRMGDGGNDTMLNYTLIYSDSPLTRVIRSGRIRWAEHVWGLRTLRLQRKFCLKTQEGREDEVNPKSDGWKEWKGTYRGWDGAAGGGQPMMVMDAEALWRGQCSLWTVAPNKKKKYSKDSQFLNSLYRQWNVQNLNYS